MITYDTLRKNLPVPQDLLSLTPLISGVLARTTVTSLSSPLELIRTRLQAMPSNPLEPITFKSVLGGVRTMVHSEGALSLWKGLGPTLWRDVPFSGVYWLGFETIKHRLNRKGYEGPGVAFASGAISGTVRMQFFADQENDSPLGISRPHFSPCRLTLSRPGVKLCLMLHRSLLGRK